MDGSDLGSNLVTYCSIKFSSFKAGKLLIEEFS